MAGHSKWANIRHRKERVDAKRGKIFTRIIREVMVAAKVGGGDAAANPRLRLALEKARAANVPNDNLERAIKRGSGALEGAAYTEVRYEGYGVGGAAVLLDCLTDNKNRTLPEVRHAFTKHGGNLGTEGSVAYLFQRCGQLLFCDVADAEKERLMEVALEHAARDFIEDETSAGVEVVSAPEDFVGLLDAVRQAGFAPDAADIVMRAETDVLLDAAQADRMQKLLEVLEDLDDTQHIYTNAKWETADASETPTAGGEGASSS